MTLLDDLKLQWRAGDVITRLIFLNLLLFVVPMLAKALLFLFQVTIDCTIWVSLSSNPINLLYKPWTLLSYAFFHVGFLHLLFNLLMLHFSGRLFLTFFTQRQLMGVYLVGAIFSGFIYLLCYALFPVFHKTAVSLLGASGAIMAVLFATTFYSPYMSLRLFLVGQVKLWQIAAVLLLLDLIQLPFGNTGGRLAHLGGALFGYLFIRALASGYDLVSWPATLIGYITGFFKPRTKKPFRTVYKNPVPNKSKKSSSIVIKDRKQQQIDDILDKISQSGYDSLSQEEKDFLFRAGEK